MTLAIACSLFTRCRPVSPPAAPPDELVLAQLQALAARSDYLPRRSLELFLWLRKAMGGSEFGTLLQAVYWVSWRSDAVGARLLAAFLDVTTLEARLVPKVRDFGSSRRLSLDLADTSRRQDSFNRDWLRRRDDLVRRATGHQAAAGAALPAVGSEPGREHPWPLLRATLARLLTTLDEGPLAEAERDFLGELLRLEVDAWQERVSRLAGNVDPFRVHAVRRLLPLLSAADGSIRDLRVMIDGIRDGGYRSTIRRQVSRARDVMDEAEFRAFRQAVVEQPAAAPLGELYQRQLMAPVASERLAAAVQGLAALEARLAEPGDPEPRATLLDLCSAVLWQGDRPGVVLELEPETAARLAELQQAADPALPPFTLVGETLTLPWPADGLEPPAAANDLPVLAVGEAAQTLPAPVPAADEEDISNSDISQLVLSSLQSLSILLGFLRNAKVTSIPGLVAAVATRTRNPQVIEVIARDRRLYSGFANREVPLACLRNPTNVSIKTLRKFIHVKYVNKVELKRMAQDRAGLRREVLQEIQAYLDSLT